MKILPFHGTLSGSAGDVTASHNRGGAYLRFRGITTNPQTALQTFVREKMAEIAKRWGGVLSADERAGFKVLADNFPYSDVLGETRKLSGQQFHNKVNALSVAAGDGFISTAPVDQEVGGILTASLSNAVAGTKSVDIAFTDDCSADEKLYVFAAVNVSVGKSYVKNLYRFAGVSSLAAVTGLTFTLPARFAAFASGTVLHLRVSKYNQVSKAVSPGVVLTITIP